MRKHDVVIIGAGASGIAAARTLHEEGLRLIVLEARERIGGRVWTHRDSKTPVPIELGAEFIHGSAEEIENILQEAHLPVVDIEGRRWMVSGTRWTPLDDFWDRLYRVMHLIKGARGQGGKGARGKGARGNGARGKGARRKAAGEGGKRDRSFQAFLDTRPGGRRLARDRKLARQFVEGFHAADPRLISTKALAESGTPGEEVRETRLGHVVDGYDRLIEWMAAPVADRVRLGAIVTRVTWSRGHAVVEVKHSDGRDRFEVEARAVLVTVPLGVLQAQPGDVGAIAFEPDLGRVKRAALNSLASGSVVRVVLHLRERVWRSLARR